MTTNIMSLPMFSGTGTAFSIANNSDWTDSIFFTAPGSAPGPISMSGSITEGTNLVTVASTLTLIPGLPLVEIPGIPDGAYIGQIPTITTFDMVDISGNPVNATMTDAAADLMFEPLPLDLSGIRFISYVRYEPGGPDVLLVVDTANGTFVNGGTNGVLSYNVAEAIISQLQPQQYVADIIAIADGRIINLFPEGPMSLTVIEGITTPP